MNLKKNIKEFVKDAADMIRPVPFDDIMMVPKGWNKNWSLSSRVKRRENYKRKNNGKS